MTRKVVLTIELHQYDRHTGDPVELTQTSPDNFQRLWEKLRLKLQNTGINEWGSNHGDISASDDLCLSVEDVELVEL